MKYTIPFPPRQKPPFHQRELSLAVRKVLLASGMTLALGFQAAGPVLAVDFPAVIQLSDLNGSNGYVLNGINNFARSSGYSVSSAGDVNADGVDDLLIGAPNAFGNDNRFSGETYVVFGGSDVGSTGVLELSDLDGANGFVLEGIDRGDLSGRAVSSAGDVNADGVDDLLIGAPHAGPNYNDLVGESYVVFGGSGVGSTGVRNLSDLNGANGFVLKGVDLYDVSGQSVSSAGDVNGDGVDDLLIGAPGTPGPDPDGPDRNDAFGETYVVFGGGGVGSTGVLELSDLNGADGFVLKGIDAGDTSGRSVSGAGDVNGDGVDDLLIGAPEAGPNSRDDVGESYVVFGGGGVGSTGVLELSDLDGVDGFVLKSADRYELSGYSVSKAGDVNDDGVDDVLIGAPGASAAGDNGIGKSYVAFGGSGVGSTGVLELSGLNGVDGFVLKGAARGDRSGRSVSSAGDVNGDGVDDLLIGAPSADPRGLSGSSSAGESYVVFGGSGVGSAGALELRDLDGVDGFVLKGIDSGDYSGHSVSSAGDVNGDGVDDLLIGAYSADVNGEETGETYVVFGVASGQQALCNGLPVTVNLNLGQIPTGGDDVIFGTPGADRISALGGNDTICGEGGEDIINASRGNDWVDGGPGHDVIRGGSGDDRLHGAAGDDTILGHKGDDWIEGGSGDDVLEGGMGNDEVRGNEGSDLLEGGGGDDTLDGGASSGDVCNGQAGVDIALSSCESTINVP